MIPLSFAEIGEQAVVKKIGGSPETKKHLEDLGFVVGALVHVVNTLSGNIIINVKDSRIAISREMAAKIYI